MDVDFAKRRAGNEALGRAETQDNSSWEAMALELTAFALAIPPTIDLCMKYGRELRGLCSTLKHAESEVAERVLRLDNGWLRFMHQLSFVSRVEHVMDDEHREIHERTLRTLLGKLEAVTLILKQLVRHTEPSQNGQYTNQRGPVLGARRMINFVFKKESLDKAIDELETWQRVADQSWFLIMKIAHPHIDQALPSVDNVVGDGGSAANAIPEAKVVRAAGKTGPVTGASITIDARELENMNIWRIPWSVAFLAQRTFSQGTVATYVLSMIQCQPLAKYDMIKGDARDLARKLQHSDPHAFGLLACKGLAVPSSIPEIAPGGQQTEPEVNFTMVFRVPERCSVESARSFRDLLLNTPGPPLSLSFRLSMASELAKAVSYVHTFGFVHKTIRPESILTFSKDGGGLSVFLVGFENFRREHGWTQRRGDADLGRNLYRHPSRQGTCPREDYLMQHDIYSLGVCLLEIGLWASLVLYDAQGAWLPTGLLLGVQPGTVDVGPFLLTKGQDRLLFLAQSRLPQVMGMRYAEIVQTCLTCLDPGNGDFGDPQEFQDQDGVRVGVRYIEKILLRLNTLVI
ncbi:hypothetical protein CEP51_006948 [Fusarium floridanum]|uniref:Protein kinase domain-containing protein n=1 Tax=Fusarium floridanum TaxID=1325733 RepID=A0A428RRC6_9HYPO|nr:hypothetical protein CEP51_006948 [Fusarium floridanum]